MRRRCQTLVGPASSVCKWDSAIRAQMVVSGRVDTANPAQMMDRRQQSSFTKAAPDRSQLGFGRRCGLLDVRAELHRPAGLIANLVDGVTGVDGVEAGLPTTFGKSEHAERRDDRRRTPAQHSVALAPAGRAVAVA